VTPEEQQHELIMISVNTKFASLELRLEKLEAQIEKILRKVK